MDKGSNGTEGFDEVHGDGGQPPCDFSRHHPSGGDTATERLMRGHQLDAPEDQVIRLAGSSH